MGSQGSKPKPEYPSTMPYGYDFQYYSNPLPIPPKEPLPAAPQTPHGLPKHLQEKYTKPKKNSILRTFSLGGSSSKPKQNITSHRKNRSDSASAIANGLSAWTYPDGTPFPSMRPELSPGNPRPKRGRSASFQGTGSRKKAQQRLMGYDDNWIDERQQEPPAWRERLGIPAAFLRRHSADEYEEDDERQHHQHQHQHQHQVPIWAQATQEEQYHQQGHQQHHRKRRSSGGKYFNSNGPTWNPKGVSNAGYVPPTAMQRSWTYPDGSPFPTLGNVPPQTAAAGGPVQESIIAHVQEQQQQVPITDMGAGGSGGEEAGPVFPSTFPAAATAMNNPNPMPSPNHVPTPSSATRAQFARNPMPAPPQMFSQTPAASITGNIPPEPLNGDRTFAFDRKCPLSYVDYHAVSFQGKIFPTAYHLWEAMNFFESRPDVARKIRKCLKVKDVRNLLIEHGVDGVRMESEQALLQRMDEVLFLKFTQHLDLLEMLLNTGDRRFLFLSRREPYWGCSPADFTGENHLGLCLERVRERFKMEGGEDMVRAWQMRRGPGPVMPMPSAAM